MSLQWHSSMEHAHSVAQVAIFLLLGRLLTCGLVHFDVSMVHCDFQAAANTTRRQRRALALVKIGRWNDFRRSKSSIRINEFKCAFRSLQSSVGSQYFNL